VIWAAIKHPHFLPTCLIFIYMATCIRYGVARDFGRVVYWFAAALINIAATWLVRK
jgi:hypothetical protein